MTDQPDKLQRILVSWGDNPKRSVRFFVTGLFLFFLGLVIVYVGAALSVSTHYTEWVWIQIPGIVVMVVGVAVALKGYVGIFCNRLAFFRHQSKVNREKYKHLE